MTANPRTGRSRSRMTHSPGLWPPFGGLVYFGSNMISVQAAAPTFCTAWAAIGPMARTAAAQRWRHRSFIAPSPRAHLDLLGRLSRLIVRGTWREAIDRVHLFTGMHRFLPTLVRMEGYQVVEMPVNHRPRQFGVSKYGAMNRAFRGLVDCLAVRWMGRRNLRYRAKEEGSS